MIDFDLTKATTPVLLDFYAPWCSHCHTMEPAFDRVAAEFAWRVLMIKINVDEDKTLMARFKVRSIPTLVALYKGSVLSSRTGAQTLAQLREWALELSQLSA